HAASVRPEPGSNSPIKFVTGSKLANHLMIDSSTLSLFSFQRAFCPAASTAELHIIKLRGTSQHLFSTLLNLFRHTKLPADRRII
ncbi:hypothetical protein, partial [Brevibacillus porteri]|uniref:hypothetical protein n=1 Tax=Brevibacillus porteri TaxID=2126350 RepID=UPI003624E588